MLQTLLIVSWIVILYIMKRLELHFFYFIIGSVGLFSLLMYFGSGSVEKNLTIYVTHLMHYISNILSEIQVLPDYRMIVISHKFQAISFFIDYECSGFLEILVYISLLSFYPTHNIIVKLTYGITGFMYIIGCNILRIIMICIVVREFGINVLFFTHVVMGRLMFFLLMTVLYYNAFTKPHILNLKVGD